MRETLVAAAGLAVIVAGLLVVLAAWNQWAGWAAIAVALTIAAMSPNR